MAVLKNCNINGTVYLLDGRNATKSTTEAEVGTWTDNRPIYERVIHFTASAKTINANGTTTWGSDVIDDNPDDNISIISASVSSNGSTYTIPCLFVSDTDVMVKNTFGTTISLPAGEWDVDIIYLREE